MKNEDGIKLRTIEVEHIGGYTAKLTQGFHPPTSTGFSWYVVVERDGHIIYVSGSTNNGGQLIGLSELERYIEDAKKKEKRDGWA